MAISREQIERAQALAAKVAALWLDPEASKKLAERRVIGDVSDARSLELVVAGATVLWTVNGEVQAYRPGRWESYIEEEYRNLMLDQARGGDSGAIDKLGEAEKERLMFGPVDDASIFPEFGARA